MTESNRLSHEQIIAKWDAMTPREKDAWVAEVVFGWTEMNANSGIPRGRNADGQRQFLSHYTTDISAAWTILNEFAAYEISGINFHTCKLWTQLHPEYYEAQTETAPEAISLAAIIAKLTEASV